MLGALLLAAAGTLTVVTFTLARVTQKFVDRLTFITTSLQYNVSVGAMRRGQNGQCAR